MAWRTLDAQFVRVEPGFPKAVPQRRRRLFIVGYLDSWEYSAEVLFEPGCFSRNPEPRRETGKEFTAYASKSIGEYSEGVGTLRASGGDIGGGSEMLCMAHGQGHAEVCEDKSPTLNCNHESPIVCKSVRMREGCIGGGKGPLIGDEISHTLGTGNDQTIICYENHPNDCRLKELQSGVCSQINARLGTGGGNGPLILSRKKKESPSVVRSYGIAENIINRKEKNGGNGIGVQEELQYTLNTAGAHGVCCFVKNDAARDSSKDVAMTLRGQAEHAVSYQSTVRRLMPIECERLMGFPDNHTQIEWNGKPKEQCPDSPRYKACGNSMCINAMRHIGVRIQKVEDSHE